jgi:hypothetical protein
MLYSAPAETTVLGRCLAVVAQLAQGLPVGGVPEQAVVASVRYGVIGHGGRGDKAGLFAANAERVALEVLRRSPAPSAPVHALELGTGAQLRPLRQVLNACERVMGG